MIIIAKDEIRTKQISTHGINTKQPYNSTHLVFSIQHRAIQVTLFDTIHLYKL